MSFGFPLGFLALAALAPLVAAYFLRRRQKPRQVSALFLWRSPSQRAQAGPRLERFSREASLALEILAVCVAAIFLADLRCGKDVPLKHLVIVVDGGLSMGAKGVADKVRDAVAKLANDEGASALTIIESGVKPSLLAGPQLQTARALALLETWRPSQPSHEVSTALLMARELSSVRGARVWFFTDGPVLEVLPPEVHAQSVAEAAENIAFLTVQRHDSGGVASVTVRVANFTKERRKIPVTFSASPSEQVQTVELDAGASAVIRVGLKTSATVRVSMPDDALAADSAIELLAAPTPPLSVGTFEGVDSVALKRFFAIAPGLTTTTPHQLVFGPPGSKANVTLGTNGEGGRSYVGPFFTQKGDPLLDDVELAGVVWTAGANPPGRALVTAGDAVLMAEEEDGTLHLNLDLSRSNLQRTSAWPVLLGNIVQRARLRAPGLPRRHLMLGEDVPVVTEGAAKWSLKGPDGRDRPVLGSGPVMLPALPTPGRWELLKDGKAIDALVVLPLDPRESDLRTRGPFLQEATADAGTLTTGLTRLRPLWPIALLLLLLLADFWLTAREGR